MTNIFKVPKSVMDGLCADVLNAAREFYRDDSNVKAFESEMAINGIDGTKEEQINDGN